MTRQIEPEEASKRPPNSPPSLMSIPLELRRKIYKSLLIMEPAITIATSPSILWALQNLTLHPESGRVHGRGEVIAGKSGASAQLLRSCNQIYDEGIDILYNGNAFGAASKSNFRLFAGLLVEERRDTIRHLRLELNLFKPKEHGRQFITLKVPKTIALVAHAPRLYQWLSKQLIKGFKHFEEPTLDKFFRRTPDKFVNPFVKNMVKRWRDNEEKPEVMIEVDCNLKVKYKRTSCWIRDLPPRLFLACF